MSDGVLAAIIAAGATVFGSFVQLRTSLAKEIAARTRSSPSRKTNHVLVVLLVVMLVGAAVGGFALAQWVFENERAAQQALVQDLRARIGDLTQYKSDIEQTRTELRSVVETDVLRRMGADGVVVLATAAPCRLPGASAKTAAATAAAPASLTAVVAKPSSPATVIPPNPAPVAACTEADAAPIVLCATIPAAAQLGKVELYARQNDGQGHWSDSPMMPGEASAKARFAAKPAEIADGSALKQVCIGFTQWSDQARIARMVVHYSL
ncbi:MAG TPA: hypothetical protein VN730_16105 [Steroidobacteraceae bacterium]|nr:hypothetical protein [Steroidobacteraceae bacterium]